MAPGPQGRLVPRFPHLENSDTISHFCCLCSSQEWGAGGSSTNNVKEGKEGEKEGEGGKERKEEKGGRRKGKKKEREREEERREGLRISPPDPHQGTGPTLLFHNMPELPRLKKWVAICMSFALNLHSVC